MRGSLWLIKPRAARRVAVPKMRPWLILQDNAFAAYGGRVACYFTSTVDEKGKPKKQRDSQVLTNWGNHASYICCDSLYTIKNSEFLEHIGDLDSDTLVKVSIAVNLILGVDHIDFA
jgi:mRNA-degrading endonuclease toxin of MazEF toxin-antitoxin module